MQKSSQKQSKTSCEPVKYPISLPNLELSQCLLKTDKSIPIKQTPVKENLNCTLHTEVDIGFATSQMIYFRKKNYILTALDEGLVLFWSLDRLLAKEGKPEMKKMVKMLPEVHSV